MLGVPSKLNQLIAEELEPGERIVWQEMPIKQYFTAGSIASFLFGIPWTAFAIFWTMGAAGFKFPDFSSPVGYFSLFGIPFILVGFGMLSAPIWTYLKAGKTIYVITDKCAISFEGGSSTVIRSFPPEKLQDIYRREKSNGTGDVIIEVKQWRDSDGDKRSDELGFLRIKNPKAAETLLKTLAEESRVKSDIRE